MVRLLQRQVATAQFLLVHRCVIERRIIAEHLHRNLGAEVDSTSTMAEGVSMIAGKHFDLALIEVVLPDMAAIDLAVLAANQNTPVLLLSDNSSCTEHVRRLGYPYLEKPLDVDLLVAESIAIVQRARLIVLDVAASADKMASIMRSLTAEVAEAHRLFDLIMSRLGRRPD